MKYDEIMSENNLFNKDARVKLKELAEGIDFTMMETNFGSVPTHFIPMSTKEVDTEGCIWFLSNKNSDHNKYLNAEKNVQLIYSNPHAMEYMTVFGHAFITTNRAILENYYSKSDDAWFDGVDDPNLSAIKVIPKKVHYWDTKSGKFVSLLKMGVAALTGKQANLGEEGELNIDSGHN